MKTMEIDSVSSVIVLFNNVEETERVIKAILGQTHLVSNIILIDNSDMDYSLKNKELLREIKSDIKLKYYKTKENIGSAGGYSVGMEIALLCNSKYIWLNDQDGIPDKNCLYELINTANLFDGKAIVAPSIYSKDNHKALSNFSVRTNIFGNNYEIKKKDNIDKILVAGSTGILISKCIVKKIGVYNSNVFFVGNEDKEYSLRARKFGIELFLLRNAIYYHPDLAIKYNLKISVTRLFPKLRKIIPMYLGLIYKNNTRSRKAVEGASYINRNYVMRYFRYFNIIYSITRTILYRIINRNVDLKVSLSTYIKYKKTIDNICFRNISWKQCLLDTNDEINKKYKCGGKK